MDKLASIIIRTRNEERWITQCLTAVKAQTYKNFEIIIVDNESADKTLEKARLFKVDRILECSEYVPGKALNMGIKASKGEYIVCLSGHCIPVGDEWLGNLLRNFEDKQVAGVYGRQEPMDFTPDSDKRDLTLIFGLDRKVQVKDSFFHNANSAIKRSVWEELPFDEKLTNIEDRAWAKEALNRKYKIVYEPDASVYHYHGIHQDGNAERCANVARILETLHKDYKYKSIDADKLNIVAIIPIRGPVPSMNNKPLLSYTIKAALGSKYTKKVIVSTDAKETARMAERYGACAPFLRDPSLSNELVDLAQVLKYSLGKMEENGIFPDVVVSLEATFPFRPDSLIDDMILRLVRGGFDSVVAARKENKGIWKENSGKIVQLEEGLTPREFKEPTFMELRGLGFITHPEFLRGGNMFGNKIGIYEIDNPYSGIEVRSEEDIRLASPLMKKWAQDKSSKV